MNRDKYGRTVLLTALAAMLALVLAGCGGDDGISQSVHDQVALERDQAQQDLMDAEAERDQAQQDLTDTEAERDQAQQDLMDAEAERDQAQQDLMDAEDRADAAEQDNQDMMDDAGMQQAMADSAAAKDLLNRALVDVLVDTDTNTAGLQPAAPDVALEVSTDGMLTAKAAGYTMADVPADMIEGWRGAMLTNMGGDTVLVYSDRGSGDPVTLFDRYSSFLPTDAAPMRWAVGSLADSASAGEVAKVSDPIPWEAVTRPDAEHTVGGPASDPVVMFEGSVHGIPGTFSCNGADAGLCAVPGTFSDGTVDEPAVTSFTAWASAWTFVPDDSAAMFVDVAADTDYLVFGWWLDKGADGLPDFVRLITANEGVGALRTETSTLGTALRGSANYKGAAAGKYAMASATADVYEGGHFTADATLMVDFDADNDAAAAGNDRAGIALSGMIDNFMTGATARPGWMVKLMTDANSATDGMQPVANLGAAIAATADADTGTDGVQPVLTTEWSTGGAQMGMGTWTAMFYGGANEAANTAHPLATTGTFNAHIGGAGRTGDGAVGRIQGAFGANKMMDE